MIKNSCPGHVDEDLFVFGLPGLDDALDPEFGSERLVAVDHGDGLADGQLHLFGKLASDHAVAFVEIDGDPAAFRLPIGRDRPDPVEINAGKHGVAEVEAHDVIDDPSAAA